MKYTDSQIEEAARILCETWGLKIDPFVWQTRLTIARYLDESKDIESALRQAVERKPNAN